MNFSQIKIPNFSSDRRAATVNLTTDVTTLSVLRFELQIILTLIIPIVQKGTENDQFLTENTPVRCQTPNFFFIQVIELIVQDE